MIDMPKKYISAAFLALIDKQDFMPITGEDGVILENPDFKVLIKYSSGKHLLVELINAAACSHDEIKKRLTLSRNIAQENPQRDFFFYKVFVFESESDMQKRHTILSEYAEDNKRVKCLCVNLAKKKADKFNQSAFTTFGIDRVLKSVLESGFENYDDNIDIYALIRKKHEENTLVLAAKKPWLTYTLMGINIAVWALLTLYAMIKGDSYNTLLIEFGAKENFRILNGEYWRFVTPIFLHANLLHMAINTYSLYAVGRTVEQIFGHLKYILVYMIAGIIGSIMSFMFSINPSVGASGSLFGLLGALLYFGVENPVLFRRYFGNNVIATIVINIIFGFSRSGIDNYAHIGGLIGGFLSSGIVTSKKSVKKYLSRPLFFIVTVTLILSGLLYGFNNNQNTILKKINYLDELMQTKSWVEAESLGEEIMAMNPSENKLVYHVLWSLTLSESSQGKYEEAIAHAKGIDEISPADSHYLLGLLYFDIKNYDMSKTELLEAKKAGFVDGGSIDSLIKELDALIRGNDEQYND
ncbi:MAG: rhomboid family intramembrane serine protease [Clostridiaceae bacterium]